MIEEEPIPVCRSGTVPILSSRQAGTGPSLRDSLTPEATLAVSGGAAPGMAEAIPCGSMAITKPAMLSGSECNPSWDR